MSLHEFKKIFYMEWGHRILGRVIGLGFVIPLAYFAVRKRLTATLPKQLFGMALLLGAQGALGWYMVKSGLEDSLLEIPGAVPRVSQYRLAAHLGTAFVLYAGMFAAGFATLMDWRYARTGGWAGLKGNDQQWKSVVNNSLVRKFARNSKALTALVFLTALSGKSNAVLSLIVRHQHFFQGHSWLDWTLGYSTMSFLSWVDVLHHLPMNFSRPSTPRVRMDQIFGGATSSKIRQQYSLIIDVL